MCVSSRSDTNRRYDFGGESGEIGPQKSPQSRGLVTTLCVLIIFGYRVEGYTPMWKIDERSSSSGWPLWSVNSMSDAWTTREGCD